MPFPESQILDYITQICLALQHIHEKKMIHRNINSNNIFVMKDGTIKLGGFEIPKGMNILKKKVINDKKEISFY